jgi:hypothetical protein
MLWLNRFLIVVVVMGSLSGALTRGGAPAQTRQNQPPLTSPAASNSDQLKAMQADAARMRVLLNQMRANLGFVGGTTSPEYHEFDLEAQMWQTLLAQMDRQIAEMQKQNSASQ